MRGWTRQVSQRLQALFCPPCPEHSSDQRYRLLVEATTAIVWNSSSMGAFEEAQPAWTAFTGQSDEELRGMGWLKVIHPDDRAETERTWSVAVANASNYKVEHRIRAADQSYRDMRGQAAPIFGADGAVKQWCGVHYDITDAKRKEDELRWKTALLEAQLNSSLDGIVVVDGEGHKILQNQRAAQLFSIPADIAADASDQVQLQWVGRVVKDPAGFMEKVVHLYSHPDEVSHDEVELLDGDILDRYSSPVLGADKKYFGRIWTFRDVTESKRLEAQFVQSQKLETVGKLAGGVAHEFNSIMTAIIGQSELLLGGLAPGDPLARSAAEIYRAAERAATLTRQLLAYGRKQILRPELLDLNTILSNLAEGLHHLMGARIDLSIDPAAGLKMVRADVGQIEQVIMNMAMNSADAMPEGGIFTIESANVTLDEDQGRLAGVEAGTWVTLTITDTGGGMSKEVRARAFEPFFTTKNVGQGAGLGLSTSYGIVKQSGGHIVCQSGLGRGTTLRIYLPQADADLPEAARPDAPGLPLGTETILLVEDDAALREMASGLLRRLGYTVLTAANGAEGLSVLDRHSGSGVDLLFTDVVMPQMNGKELSERAREASPDLNILFTSSYTENSIVYQGGLNKGCLLLQKPYAPSALAHKVREAIDQV